MISTAIAMPTLQNFVSLALDGKSQRDHSAPTWAWSRPPKDLTRLSFP